ncbi:hypothetical protein AKJ16_DCAP14174 [Drosera capensis]
MIMAGLIGSSGPPVLMLIDQGDYPAKDRESFKSDAGDISLEEMVAWTLVLGSNRTTDRPLPSSTLVANLQMFLAGPPNPAVIKVEDGIIVSFQELVKVEPADA